MNETDVEVRRISATSPEAAKALMEMSQAAEAFGEPSGTLAEARRQGADIGDESPELETVVERHARLEEARGTMWKATTHNTGGALIGSGAQEEETARIADHLVFPGTGIRELREQGRLEEAAELAAADRETPTHNPDRFPPSEWPPAEQQDQDDGGAASSSAEQRPGFPMGVLATSKRALSQPWVLAGACLGAGLVSGLILRAVMDRMAQRDASGGTAKGAGTANGRGRRVADAVKSRMGDVKAAAVAKAEDVKAAALAKADEVKEAAKSKAGEVKEVAKNKAGDVKEAAKNKAGDVKEAAKNKAGDVKEAARSKAGEVRAAAGGKVGDVRGAARSRATGVKAPAKSTATKGAAAEQKPTNRAKAGEAKQSVKPKAGQGREPAGTRVARARTTPSKGNGSRPSASGGRTRA